MKLVSINYLVGKSKESLLRFPLTILSGLLGVATAIYLVEYADDIPNVFPHVNFLLTCALGVPLFFCAAVVAEKHGSKSVGLIGALVSAVILLLIYLSLPTADETHNTYIPYIRYGVFNVIIHLLVSFAPFFRTKQLIGFWNYNKGLFIRVIVSAIYSGVLYIGLIMALTALKVLFDMDIHEELYAEIWIVIVGLFNTWFFVAGLPKDLNELENDHDYPKGLKIFAQYVLLPLLVLYLVILYAYGSKIMIEWDWPKGIVSYMITVVSVLGILNVLLIHPYGSLDGNSWIRKFSKAYYWLLFPLIALLFMAIYMRVEDYGITINRYAIIALGIWLTIVASYFSFTKGNIKFVPISLAMILTLSSFGPWGMFSVSERSQVNRLERILSENGILVDGKVINEPVWVVDSLTDGGGLKGRRWKHQSLANLYAENELKNEDVLNESLHNEVKSILDYLDDHHGFSSIRPWFNQDIDSLLVAADATAESRLYMRSLGLKYQHKYLEHNKTYYDYRIAPEQVINVSGYDYFLSNHRVYEGRTINHGYFEIEGHTLWTELVNNEFKLHYNEDTITIGLLDLVKELRNKHGQETVTDLESATLLMERESELYEVRLQISEISIKELEELEIQNISYDMAIKKKE